MIAIGLIANPDLNWYHGVVMSESFFVTASVATLASMIRFTRQDSEKKSIVLAALFAGITASLRPTGYAFLPAVIILILMHRQALGLRFWRSLAIGFFIMLAVVGAERIGWRIIHGPEARGYAAQQLFAKAALIDAPAQSQAETDPVRRVFIHGLEEDFKPIRDVIDKAPTANIRQFLTLFYEECLEFGCSYPLATQLGKETDDLAINDIKFDTALERIARAPLSYAHLVWVHYRSLWHIYAHNHPGFMEEFKAFADPLRPLPFSEVKQTQIFNADIPPKKLALVARPAVMGVGILTALAAALGLLGLFRNRTGPFLAVAATTSLAAHGALLLTAMLGLGLARYTMAVWPEMVVGSLFALFTLLKALKKEAV